MDLNKIQIFVWSIEMGSLAAVARKMKLSAAAVSKQLNKLEQEVNVQLLVRTTRKLELTEIGRNYYHQCKRILEEVEEARLLISQATSNPQGKLKVITPRYFGSTYIVPYIKDFMALYPKLELNLELSERIPNINKEGIDLMMGMSIPLEGEIIQKRIGETYYCLCASSQYLEEYGIPQMPADLRKHRYISHSMRNPENELTFNNKEKIILQPFLQVNDAQTILELTLQGIGISSLHHYVVQNYLKNGRLKELLIDFRRPPQPLYAAFSHRRFVASKIRCFMDFVTEKIVN